jgi:hypothetical protein
MNTFSSDNYANAKMKEAFGDFYETFDQLRNLQSVDPIQASMPYVLKIK